MPEPLDTDVAIAGGGVVGCAIARELTRFRLRVTLLEAGPDVGAGTSKANTALLHTGFDAKPGTLEARLVARGYELLGAYAERVGIPVERTGALLVAWTEEQPRASRRSSTTRARTGRSTCARWASRSSTSASRSSARARTARSRCRARRSSARSPRRSRTRPRRCSRAATCASSPVTSVARLEGGGFRLGVPGGELTARYLVNAAGLRSDELDRMAGHDGFTITPRRGELIVFDKLARPLVEHIVLAVPTAVTKGVLIAPTVFGNVMLGPTAEDVERKDDTDSTRAGLDYLRAEGARIMPELLRHEVTAVYAGLRAATEHPDYQLSVHAPEGYVRVAGIRSTGLSASMAIAEHVRDGLAEAGLGLEPRRRAAARVHDAEHRRARPARLPARRPGAPRLRAHRLLL